MVSLYTRQRKLTLVLLCALSTAVFATVLYLGRGEGLFLYAYVPILSKPNKFISGHVFAQFADFRFQVRMAIGDARKIYQQKLFDGAVIYVKTEHMRHFSQFIRDANVRYILITHNSDAPITNETFNLIRHSRLIRWFSTNTAIYHPLLTTIPLGLFYADTTNKQDHNMENLAILRNLPAYKDRKVLLYINFSLWSNVAARLPALLIVERTLANRCDIDYGKRESKLDYLGRLRNVKFVLSPPGFGIDCFRTWEALMMGCVPIVLNTTIAPVYRDAPVMIVEKWEDVTIDSLLAFEKNLQLSNEGVLRTEVIKAEYWWRKIVQYK